MWIIISHWIRIKKKHAENVSQAINSTKDDAKLKVNLEKKIEMMEKFNESLADHEREDTSWVVGFFFGMYEGRFRGRKVGKWLQFVVSVVYFLFP